VRNWFSTLNDGSVVEGGNAIWIAYNRFTVDLEIELKGKHYTDEELENIPVSDFIKFAKDWVRKFKT
jgi:hypothetical protein